MSLPTREQILAALNEQRRRLGKGERVEPERFDNRTNPDGSAIKPGGFTAADHLGKQYAAPGCKCSSCAGKQERP